MFKRFYLWLIFLLFNASLLQADQGGVDSFGHMWTNSSGTVSVDYNWIDARTGTELLDLSVTEDDTASFDLPFSFQFYGESFSKIWVSTNGWVSFAQPSGGDPSYLLNGSIPAGAGPDSLIAVYWDEMIGIAGGGGNVYYDTIGTAPNRKVIIQWDVQRNGGAGAINVCQVILYEQSNLIKLQYNILTGGFNGGSSATIGIKKNTTDGVEYSFNTAASVAAGMAILFHNKYVDSAEGLISPISVEAGGLGNFTYTIGTIDATPVGLGKLDRFSIGNPFANYTHGYTVSKSIIIWRLRGCLPIHQQTQDLLPGILTPDDSIVVQTSEFDVIDSLVVGFYPAHANDT